MQNMISLLSLEVNPSVAPISTSLYICIRYHLTLPNCRKSLGGSFYFYYYYYYYYAQIAQMGNKQIAAVIVVSPTNQPSFNNQQTTLTTDFLFLILTHSLAFSASTSPSA